MAKRIYKREPKISLLERKFGDLTVIGYDPSVIKRNRSTWLCECSCGNKTNKLTSELVSGFAKSCGCHIKLKLLGSHEKIGNEWRDTKELRAWYGMKARCYNKNTIGYEHYGNRGISVCPEWLNSFFTFLKDMGKAPTEKHSIDRIDVNGNYSRENCRWADNKQQQNNKTDNLKVYFDGKTYSGSMFCETFKVSLDFFRRRFEKGDSPEAILKQYEKVKEFGGRYFSSKLVSQYDLNGNFIKNWASVSEASRFLGLRHSNFLSRAIKKNKEIKGFIWKFTESS